MHTYTFTYLEGFLDHTIRVYITGSLFPIYKDTDLLRTVFTMGK